MIATLFNGQTSSITRQSLGGIELCVPAAGAKMWCLFVCFCLFVNTPSLLQGRRAVRSRGHNWNKYHVAVYGSTLTLFSFRRDAIA